MHFSEQGREERRLPGPDIADDGNELSGLHLQVDARQGRVARLVPLERPVLDLGTFLNYLYKSTSLSFEGILAYKRQPNLTYVETDRPTTAHNIVYHQSYKLPQETFLTRQTHVVSDETSI